MHTDLHLHFAASKSMDVVARPAEALAQAPVPPASTIVLRRVLHADDPAVTRLAALDSRRVPAAPYLVAEVDGEPLAALSLTTGEAFADPFARSAHAVMLLRERAAHLHPAGSAAAAAPQAPRAVWRIAGA